MKISLSITKVKSEKRNEKKSDEDFEHHLGRIVLILTSQNSFQLWCGSRYTYHFVDAFTTFVLSCATPFMDVEFSTVPVEQGHKK